MLWTLTIAHGAVFIGSCTSTVWYVPNLYVFHLGLPCAKYRVAMSVSSSVFVMLSSVIHSISFGVRVSHFLPCGSPIPLMLCLLNDVFDRDFCPGGNDHGAPSALSDANDRYVDLLYQHAVCALLSPAKRYSPGGTGAEHPVCCGYCGGLGGAEGIVVSLAGALPSIVYDSVSRCIPHMGG